jgi:hypothetical protein
MEAKIKQRRAKIGALGRDNQNLKNEVVNSAQIMESLTVKLENSLTQHGTASNFNITTSMDSKFSFVKNRHPSGFPLSVTSNAHLPG